MFKELMTPAEKKRFRSYRGPLKKNKCRDWFGPKGGGRHVRSQFGICRDGHTTVYNAHRIAHSLAHKNEMVPLDGTGGLDCCHDCGVSDCVSEKHTRMDTRKGNMADAIRHGTIARGDRKPNTLLLASQIPFIRNAYDNKLLSMRKMAERYGVSYGAIRDVCNRRNWEWVPEAQTRTIKPKKGK